jgi:nitroimidazol reductase NimA-like FMN-containing flavoprotein (pyridoxamine 5'-phosphate oxidase superfamily)
MTDLMTLPQDDVRLLDTELAQGLLTSTELARMAYVARDGTPRVFPMMFHWDGEELVFATFEGAQKIRALRARPDVALTIDRPGLRMARIVLRPTWVGLVDFQTRLPGPLSGRGA